MDSRHLVPPSHFDADSLESSPKYHGMPCPLPSGNALINVNDSVSNAVLKTPDDFMLPSPQAAARSPNYACCVGKKMPISACTQYGLLQNPDGPSDCTENKLNIPIFQAASNSENEAALLVSEIKKENKKLKEILMTYESEKDSKSSMNVITHQVQYIERLQQDLSEASSRLKCREEQLSKQQLEVQEVNLQCQKLVLEIKKLEENMVHEKEDKLKLSDIIAELKESLAASKEDQQRLQKVYDEKLLVMRQNHADELHNVGENARKVRKEMKSQFDNDKESWEKDQAKLLKEWELKHKDVLARYESSIQANLQEIEKEKTRTKERERLLEGQISQIEKDKAELRLEMGQMGEQLEETKENTRAQQSKIEELQELLKNEKHTVATLKAYISQVQADEHAVAQWKSEKQNLNEKFERSEEEKEELKKTLEMLNVRFQSVSKILEMQEESIAAHTTAISDPQSQNKAAVVTSRWRMKVFELMVQSKSQEIVLLEESSRHKIALKDLNIRLEEQTREKEIAANRLSDVEAQLHLKGHVNQTLESQNKKLKEDLQRWKTEVESQDTAGKKLRHLAIAMKKTLHATYETYLSSVMEKCLRLEQRLAFANNRLRTVGDLLKRRDAMWRVKLQQASHKEDTTDTTSLKQKCDLSMEILHLTEERDLLSQQLAHDAAQFEQTIKSMRKDEDNHKQANNKLEKQIISFEEKINELSSKLGDLNSTLEDERYEKEALLEELKEINKKKEQEKEKVVEEEKANHYEQLQEKEVALAQVKRELTKTVVALRQAERSAVREKNRLSEQIELERKSWLSEEEKLRNEMRNFQKDNNLLMTTLRQEGLVSAFKAARAQPMTIEDDVPVKRVHFNTPPLKQEAPTKAAQPTDVDKMLQDLTNLSEKLLADSD